MSIRKYPDKFVVKSEHYTWNVSYVPERNHYNFESRPNGFEGGGLHYTATEMDGFNKNTYKFIFPEPELVFPFTFKEKVGKGHFKVVKINDDIYLHCQDDKTWVSRANLYTPEDIKRFIKSGSWIVQSVGTGWYFGELKPIDTLTVKVSTTEALACVKELTEAVDTLTDAFANLNAVMRRFKIDQSY